jgi:hypothetical protein
VPSCLPVSSTWRIQRLASNQKVLKNSANAYERPSDLELRRFGERARKLSDPKMNFGATEPHVIELEEARAACNESLKTLLCHS